MPVRAQLTCTPSPSPTALSPPHTPSSPPFTATACSQEQNASYDSTGLPSSLSAHALASAVSTSSLATRGDSRKSRENRSSDEPG